MQTVRILTFSGTGNTAFVAEELVKALQQKGMEASSYPMEKLLIDTHPEAVLSADLIGIAFPVHAFNPPGVVEKILRRLPARPGRTYFIVKTAGDPFANGGTTTKLQKILRHKGWELRYEALVPMPANVMLRYTDPFIKLIGEMAIKHSQIITQDLLEGNRKTISKRTTDKLLAFIAKPERLGALFYGRYLKVGSDCTQCGLCARECPTGNISMQNGKFFFGWKCSACFRCIFNCPVQAFSQKHLGRIGMLKQSYDLKAIMADNSIKAADLSDDSLPGMKSFRNYWFRAGVIE